MGMMASKITSLTIVFPTVYSGAAQRKHQNSKSLAFVWGIHWSSVNSPHKGQWLVDKEPVMQKMFPFDDVITLLKWKAPGNIIIRKWQIPFDINTIATRLPYTACTMISYLMLQPWVEFFFWEYICIFNHFSILRYHSWLQLSLVEVMYLFNPKTTENTWVCNQHCGYCCPGAKAPGHQ